MPDVFLFVFCQPLYILPDHGTGGGQLLKCQRLKCTITTTINSTKRISYLGNRSCVYFPYSASFKVCNDWALFMLLQVINIVPSAGGYVCIPYNLNWMDFCTRISGLDRSKSLLLDGRASGFEKFPPNQVWNVMSRLRTLICFFIPIK